jgi:23S rRNA pseudouridine1911/1915/1917 synthase
VGHQTGTLVHAVLGHAPDIRGIGEEGRPGVVHRTGGGNNVSHP